MLPQELHKRFKIAIDKEGISTVPSFTAIEIDYWINTAQDRLINLKFTGTNPRRIGIDQDQKRIDDLSRLYTSSQEELLVTEGSRGYDVYTMVMPSDYMHLVSVDAGILIDDKYKEVQPIECTLENISSKLSNSLSEHRVHNGDAKPLQVMHSDSIKFYTDKSYVVEYASIVYVRKPSRVIYSSNVELTHFPDYMWDEVISLATRLALSNTADSRYSTYAQESQIVE